MISNYFQKNQPSIQRDVQKKCMLCSKQFRIGRSQHQCKRCLRAICSDCGKEKIMLFKTGFARNPHRGCKLCVQEINNFHRYINQNQIAFGKMSVVGEKWTKKIDKLSSYLPAENRKKNEFKRQIFSRMWDSYNYSMRQFIGLLTFEKHQQEIYQSLSEVIKTVFSIFPNQDLQSVCYLSIFFLCFCTPDKAALLCLHIIQLQNTVVNSQGLIEAYLKALGINEQKRIQQYVKATNIKYLSSLSVNIAHINSSIYLIDKIITRRKIDEVYIFFCLSIDLIKDTIVQGKDDISTYNLLLARNCSPNAVSIKHRQVSNVKSSAYMKQIEEELIHSTSNLTATSFLDTKPLQKKNTLVPGFKSFVESPINAKKSNESVHRENVQFQRQFGAEVNNDSNDNDDSMSTISMLQEMKQLRKTSPQHSDSKQILALLNADESHSPYQELSLVKYQSSMEVNTGRSSLKGFGFTKQAQSSEPQLCRKCQIYLVELQSLRKQLKQNNRISEMMGILKEDNNTLKEKVNRLQQELETKQLRQASTRESILAVQKSQLDQQLRRFKQTISEYQQREREFQQREREFQQRERKFQQKQSEFQLLERDVKLKEKQLQQVMFQNEECQKTIKKQSIEIKRLQSQQEQSGMTLKMLKNRLQTQSLQNRSFQQRQSESTDSSTSESKIVEMLKNNVKDKNSQIEELTKRNKLLSYQLEDLSKNAKKDQEISTIKAKVEKLQADREGMMKKLNELSLLLMNEEGEKLRLSQQNFTLKQLLRHNKIAYES